MSPDDDDTPYDVANPPVYTLDGILNDPRAGAIRNLQIRFHALRGLALAHDQHLLQTLDLRARIIRIRQRCRRDLKSFGKRTWIDMLIDDYYHWRQRGLLQSLRSTMATSNSGPSAS